MITIHSRKFKPLLTKREIEEKINLLAEQIDSSYDSQSLTFLIVLKGAFYFGSYLSARLTLPHQIAFTTISSYNGLTSTENIKMMSAPEDDLINGRHVLIVEDIIDTGHSARFLQKYILTHYSPLSLHFVPMIIKHTSNTLQDIPILAHGFDIEDKFVVGFGMDYLQEGRNLSSVYVLAE